MIGEKQIVLSGQNFLLNTFKTVYWEQQNALLIADLHIGKAAHFRKHGIAIPGNYLIDDFARLDACIRHYDPLRIFILGDLVHAAYNLELEMLEVWLRQHRQYEFHLIAGNHDRHSTPWIRSLDLQLHEQEMRFDNCLLTHKPQTSAAQVVISGHIHPGVALRSYQGHKVRVPAFLVSADQLILPAFSAFTGLDTAYAADKSFERYAITKTHIILC